METSLIEAYLTMFKASGLKVGDTVKVLRKAKEHEMGWANTWTGDMDQYVGKVTTITGIPDRAERGVALAGGGIYSYPFYILEKVKSAKPELPSTKEIDVNGRSVRMTYSHIFDDVRSYFLASGTEASLGADTIRKMSKAANAFLKQHRAAITGKA